MSPRSPWVIASDARVNLRGYGSRLLALLLILPAAPVLPARAADARPASKSTVDVRPVAPAEEVLREQRKGLPQRAVALTAAEKATLDARLKMQRAFRPFEEQLHAPAARVGSGLQYSRRPGWKPPLASGGSGTRRLATAGVAPPPPPDTI